LALFETITLVLVGVGLLSGFLGGLLGIGGGVVIVPALILVFETNQVHQAQDITIIAVATSLACIIFTSASAAYTQYRAEMVRWDLVQKLALFLVLGSFSAGVLAPLLPPPILLGMIGCFLTLVAIVMLTSWKPQPHRSFPGMLGASGIGYLGGNVAGFAGIAGGNVIVPTLVFFNVPIHNATATSSALGVPIATAGALSYAFASGGEISFSQVGYVDLASFATITVCAVLTAPIGVRVAHAVPSSKLKRVFGGLLGLAALRMIYSALTMP